MPDLLLNPTSLTSGLVVRGASGGANDSSFAVVNIQAMQVEWGAPAIYHVTPDIL